MTDSLWLLDRIYTDGLIVYNLDMQTILVVEDNVDMRRAVAEVLTDGGFTTIGASSAENALIADNLLDIDLGIIDINLPGKSGFELVKELREIEIDVPLIAITARHTLADRIKGLESGFSDYVVKPFDMNELVARVHAHLRQAGHNQQLQKVTTTDRFSIEPDAFEFYMDDEQVELTKIEFRIMQLLMEQHGSLVQLDDIIEFAWGEQADLINPPIRIHIANLRKKIGDSNYRIIKTIPGMGYKLVDGK